jgi:hypothetical protein
VVGKFFGPRLAASSAESNSVWIFHAFSLYLALRIVKQKSVENANFSLDKHTQRYV